MRVHHRFVLLRYSFASNNGWQVSMLFSMLNSSLNRFWINPREQPAACGLILSSELRKFNKSLQQGNKLVSKKKKCNKVVCAIVHKFAYIKTIECNNVVSSSIGFACSSWNFVKRYDLVALRKIHVCNKVVTI